MSTSNINTANIDDLKPLIGLRRTGVIFEATTAELGEKLAVLLKQMDMDNLDSIFFTAHTASDNNPVGIDDLVVKAYFVPRSGSSIYFKSGGGKDAAKTGNFAVIKTNSNYGTGPFGITDKFRQVMAPLCPDDPNDADKVVINLTKSTTRGKVIAVLNLDPMKTLAFLLGVNDPGVFLIRIMAGVAIPTEQYAHKLAISVKVNMGSSIKGKTSGYDLRAQLAQQMQETNNRNRGRQY